MNAENLKERTAQGLLWGAVNNGTMQVLNLLIGLFLARILSPAEYGIVGVLTIFTIIAGNLQSSGFSQGLINLKEPTAKDYNSVFWFNICTSLVCYGILFACAPLIARFFKEPELIMVSRVVFLGFVVSSVGIAQNAYLIKNMRNREIAISNLLALVISGGVALVSAYMGCSYWSLVWQQLAYITVLNIGRYYYSTWRPTIEMDFEPIKRMFPFSVNILFTNLLNTLNQQMLTVLFGRMFSAGAAVGNYTQANKWSMMGSQTISGTLQQIAQTVFVSAADQADRELRVFRKMLRFTSFLAFPAMLGLAMVAREFILCTIGNQWEQCVPLLQMLCIGGAFLPLYTLLQNLLISKGRSDYYLWMNAAQIVLQLTIILLFHRYGMQTMVMAYCAFTIIWVLAWHPFAHQLIGLKLIDALKDTLPFLVVTIAVMAATYILTQWIENLWILLFVRITMAAGLYFVVMKLLGAEILKECLQFIKKKE